MTDKERSEHEQRIDKLVVAGMASLTEEERRMIVSEAIQCGWDSYKLRDSLASVIDTEITRTIREIVKTPEMQEFIRDRAEVILRDAIACARVTMERRF